MKQRRRLVPIVVLGLVLLALPGCLRLDVLLLSSDQLQGRQVGTPGNARARAGITERLAEVATGPIAGATGAAAYQQPFPAGVNVLGLIRGKVRPNEYVVVGAHYDHLGNFCDVTDPGVDDGKDHLCNGATDNATGVAAVLELAARFSKAPPDRSVLFALWDGEEADYLGSRHYVAHPVVPLAATVAYVNLDILGADLLPSLGNTSFAVGAETGGPPLRDAVRRAADDDTLDLVSLSATFSAGRSDDGPFRGAEVPSVFFSDSTGGCYHTPEDEYDKVDFAKLDRQVDVVEATVRGLANAPTRPTWTDAPPATYDDALGVLRVLARSRSDEGRFSVGDQARIADIRAKFEAVRARGRSAFSSADHGPVLLAALSLVNLMASQPCVAVAGEG